MSGPDPDVPRHCQHGTDIRYHDCMECEGEVTQRKVDQAWNAALEKAAEVVARQFGNMNPTKVADRVRALKREVKS